MARPCFYLNHCFRDFKMRFAHHLSSHLTPEWRKHYIDYDDLKRRVYEMIGKKPQAEDEELLEGTWALQSLPT